MISNFDDALGFFINSTEGSTIETQTGTGPFVLFVTKVHKDQSPVLNFTCLHFVAVVCLIK